MGTRPKPSENLSLFFWEMGDREVPSLELL